MRRSIADYCSLLAHSVPEKYSAEAREELYGRARSALVTEFGKLNPPPADADVWNEQLKLDFAIYDFEWSFVTQMSYTKSA
jgi:hypothetical protein